MKRKVNLEAAFNLVKHNLDMRATAQEFGVTYLRLFYELSMYEPYIAWCRSYNSKSYVYRYSPISIVGKKRYYTECLYVPEKWDYRIKQS